MYNCIFIQPEVARKGAYRWPFGSSHFECPFCASPRFLACPSLRAHAIGGHADSVSLTAEWGISTNNKVDAPYVADSFAFAVVIAVRYVYSIGIACGLLD